MAKEREHRGGAVLFALGLRPGAETLLAAGRLSQALLVGLAFTGGTYGFVRLAGSPDTSSASDATVRPQAPVWPPPGIEEPGPEATPAEGLLGLIPGVYYAPAAASTGRGGGARPSGGPDDEPRPDAGTRDSSSTEKKRGDGMDFAADLPSQPAAGRLKAVRTKLAGIPSLRDAARNSATTVSGFGAEGRTGAMGVPASRSGTEGTRGRSGAPAMARDAVAAGQAGPEGTQFPARRAMRGLGGGTTGLRAGGTRADRGQSRIAPSFVEQGRLASEPGGAPGVSGGGAAYGPAGASNALGQLRSTAGQSRAAAGQAGEAASQSAGLPFDGGAVSAGGGTGAGSSRGTEGPGGSSSSGSPIIGDDRQSAAPGRIAGKNLTPYQSWVTAAQYLLMAASIMLLLAYLLSRTVFGASWAMPLARVAAALAAGAAALGVAIMSQGQLLQGAIFTFSGAALAYLSWTAPFGDARAANPGASALEAAAPPATEASQQLGASQLGGSKTWWVMKEASQLPFAAATGLQRAGGK